MGKIFISYSHKDREWKDRLLTYLSVLEKAGLLGVWDDQRIEDGDKWLPEIEQAINSADVAILLITNNFLDSEFITEEEIPRLIRRYESDSLRIIPIILESCDWKNHEWLRTIQGRTIHDKPLSSVDADQIHGNFSELAKDLIVFFKLKIPSGYPLQRPPRVEYFTGREAELDQLLKDLQPGRVATLCGPGGIGKTALSSEAIWRLAPGDEAPELFPDGIVFYSFYGQPDMALAFEHIVRSFDKNAQDTSPDAARRILSGKQALLILDGAEEADDLRKVLEIRDRCGILVTSRSMDDAAGDWQDIAFLPIPEAVELLQALAEKQSENSDAVRQICELTGGLPLAVRLVGYYLSRHRQRAESYLEWLKDSPLAALNQGDRRELSVPLLLERSIAQVPEDAQQALALTGLLALSPFSENVIASVFDIPPYKADHILGTSRLLRFAGTPRKPLRDQPSPDPHICT